MDADANIEKPILSRALESLSTEWEPDYILPFPTYAYERLVELKVAERIDHLELVHGKLVPNHTRYRRTPEKAA